MTARVPLLQCTRTAFFAITMAIVCPFCEKPCPPDAKFCSACGGALHLAPCPACGAVNDVSAASCFQCGERLGGPRPETAETAPVEKAEAPPASARGKRSPVWIAAGLVILGAVGVLGYFALAPRTEMAAPATPTVVDTAPREAGPARIDAGAITPVLPERPVAAPSPTRPERKAVESIRPRAPKAPAREAQATRRVEAAKGIGTAECTAQALALGLCREAGEAPAPVAPAAVPRGDEECTEVAAALGLCEPTAAQRGN
jgi:hypothetical protein